MNERIQELADQAYRLAYPNTSLYDDDNSMRGEIEFEKKFAELIIKECLMIVYERQVQAPTDDDGYFKVATDMVSTDIKLHFGVKE
jgi:hypothetical protein